MDTKDTVSVWAGTLTLAVFVAEDRVSNALAYSADSSFATVIGTLVGYAIGFVIVYFIIRWLLEHCLKGTSQPQPTAPPPSFRAIEVNPEVKECQDDVGSPSPRRKRPRARLGTARYGADTDIATTLLS